MTAKIIHASIAKDRLETLSRNLQKRSPALKISLERWGNLMVDEVSSEIKSQDLIRSGRLLRSTRHYFSSPNTLTVTSDAPYAFNLEYGIERPSARLFFSRSYEKTKGKLAGMIAEGLSK